MDCLIAFDLDGTLLDTPAAIVEAFTSTFASIGVPVRDTPAVRATIGLPLERAFATLIEVPAEDELVRQAVAAYQTLFRQLILPRAGTLVFPGVVDGLAALRDRGAILAVATSKFSASAEAILVAAGLREWFHLVVGADQVHQPKPHPEMAHLIMRRTGVPAGRAVMVGDTTHDLLMARAAQMRSIAVTYGVHDVARLATGEPTWFADTFDGVRERVQNELMQN